MLAGTSQPFLAYLDAIAPLSSERAAIAKATRLPEPEILPSLMTLAKLDDETQEKVTATATNLIGKLRAKKKGIGVEALLQEYTLDSQEGVALMCLAEALLRIPDTATRDALIRDKIGHGDWQTHLGHSPSLFVNAASWGLYLTGHLTATHSSETLAASLTRLIAKGGEPIIRRAIDLALRIMSEHFVTGQTIDKALANARTMEAKGFAYSYDMLGEAAMTASDAVRYTAAYEEAIAAIGAANQGRGLYDGPGISIKLSALHPRYNRSQRARVMSELLPRVKTLCLQAKQFGIGLNIDAEESERLDLSLDILTSLCHDADLAGWHGLGFVVQAYQKRARLVVRHVIALARETNHRLMVRLVKGAYWDSEIKRAQLDGLEDFPVFTRKIHTDVSYLACAKIMLAAKRDIFPQFATHNAQTLAHIMALAGDEFQLGDYEFQCLHGMGEALYEEVVGTDKLARPCRIYAPVGAHETLLAYLVRRLIENGANTSFVNRIADPDVAISALTQDPVREAESLSPVGRPHDKIASPPDLYQPERVNAKSLDLNNELVLRDLAQTLHDNALRDWKAEPLAVSPTNAVNTEPVNNPANLIEVIGTCQNATISDAQNAFLAATTNQDWQALSSTARATILSKAADLLEENTPALLSLLIREAGKTTANALSEVREAVDFLRYYGAEVRAHLENTTPLGTIVCISPWNFPLAIFLGQISAALAAGNNVIAKPAEETPLIATSATRLLHEAGVPRSALQLLTGAGDIGAALVAHQDCNGVMFTGSTEVAKLISKTLSGRLHHGAPIPLIAETGGQNAMIVDSSALTEQVVADIISAAFDSAGQRCSALRVLCVQEECAERTLTMLKGAMAELVVGSPQELATDIGPVISQDAQSRLLAHITAMQRRGFAVHTLPLPALCARGNFVAPTLIEMNALSDLKGEVFGPVLHVLRYKRKDLAALLNAINATGFGLTFGLHTRIDETIAQARNTITAGNVYINRNIIGAIVNVQPFGGHGLSGTGPKAGGPLQLRRLVKAPPKALPFAANGKVGAAFATWRTHLAKHADAAIEAAFAHHQPTTLLDHEHELKGPVGEANLYHLGKRGAILCVPASKLGAVLMVAQVLAAGSKAYVYKAPVLTQFLGDLPKALHGHIIPLDDLAALHHACDFALYEGDSAGLLALQQHLAARDGALITIQARTPEALEAGHTFEEAWLYHEQSISMNTAAAGGNASLMTIG